MDYKKLIEAGVHFGHQKTRWCPLMKPYIWGFRSGIHLIDVSKTLQSLEKAGKFLEKVAAEGKPILWVGTKPAAQKIITEIAEKVGSPYISYRWVGGLLTNHTQVKKSLLKMLNYEDVLKKAEDYRYTKKELSVYNKIVEKLNRSLKGVRDLTWPVGAVVIIDAKKETTALKEAIQSQAPTVALVDTNTDPTGIDFVIPGNDDSPKSIKIIAEYLAGFIEKGKLVAAENAKKAKKEAEEKRAVAAKKEVKASDDHKSAARPVAKKPIAEKPVVKAAPVKKEDKLIAKAAATAPKKAEAKVEPKKAAEKTSKVEDKPAVKKAEPKKAAKAEDVATEKKPVAKKPAASSKAKETAKS
jgi:small subunit ribosomal protein S2